jgi:MYXO-CTERM domain-containing protein
MKSTIKVIAFLIASGSLASAASITVAAFADTSFTTGADVALNSTYTAKIGFLAAAAVLDDSSTYAYISSNWTNAGDISFASGDASGYAGYFSGLVSFTDLLGLAGKAVSIWVTDGSGQNAVLTHNSITFLADSAIPNANSLDIDATTLGDFTLKMGSYSTTGANGTNGGSFVVVPEPSAALLGAIGALGLLRRRRI